MKNRAERRSNFLHNARHAGRCVEDITFATAQEAQKVMLVDVPSLPNRHKARMCGLYFCVVVAAGLFAGAAGGQTIYRCETAQGTTYSQQPCAKPGSSRMKKVELPPDHAPHLDDLLRGAAAERAADEQLRQSRLARGEVACIDAQVAATRVGTRRRVAGLQSQIRVAEYSMGVSNNNLAGATRLQGLQERVAALQAAISTQQQILAQTELTARTICADRRAAADAPRD